MFEPNQKVVCINDTDVKGNTLTKGEIYTVVDIFNIFGEFGISLAETTPLFPTVGYKIQRFRAIDDSGVEDMLEDILEQAKKEDKTSHWKDFWKEYL